MPYISYPDFMTNETQTTKEDDLLDKENTNIRKRCCLFFIPVKSTRQSNLESGFQRTAKKFL